jgi:hypothetical protein
VSPDTRDMIKGLLILIAFFAIMAMKEIYEK